MKLVLKIILSSLIITGLILVVTQIIGLAIYYIYEHSNFLIASGVVLFICILLLVTGFELGYFKE